MPSSVEVRWFASLADRTGVKSETVELSAPIDVAGLWRLLLVRHPALAGCGFKPLVACDQQYASWDRDLAGVREVAFLPPVSGG